MKRNSNFGRPYPAFVLHKELRLCAPDLGQEMFNLDLLEQQLMIEAEEEEEEWAAYEDYLLDLASEREAKDHPDWAADHRDD